MKKPVLQGRCVLTGMDLRTDDRCKILQIIIGPRNMVRLGHWEAFYRTVLRPCAKLTGETPMSSENIPGFKRHPGKRRYGITGSLDLSIFRSAATIEQMQIFMSALRDGNNEQPIRDFCCETTNSGPIRQREEYLRRAARSFQAVTT